MKSRQVVISMKTNVYAVKGNWQLDGSMQSRIMAMVLAMAAEIERDLISQRTKEALAAKKQLGMKLGRPIGSGRSRLDAHRADIERLLANGSTQKSIAERYGISEVNLSRWLKKRGIK
jgi:DNA invertase Pin-like site-specific DNA recombinase